MKTMRVIGLLGGVASGKSTVARYLAAMGAAVLDADRAGHEVLRLPRIEAAARQRWGDRVLRHDGRIDRSRLAEIVFVDSPAGKGERKYLEELTHPEIERLLRRQAEELSAAGTEVAVLDAPLLLEAGWERLCDRLIYVEAPREARRDRALRRGWTEEEFDAREGAQESLDSKRERADVIVDTSGSLGSTRARTEQIWHSLFP